MPSTSAKRLNRRDLALHDGLGREGADIAEAKHGGAVGDDGNHVAAGRIGIGQVRVGLDAQAGHGHAG